MVIMNEEGLIGLIEASMDIHGHNDFEVGLMGSYFNSLRIELRDYILIEQGDTIREDFDGVEVIWKPVSEYYFYMGIRIVNMGGTHNGYVVTDKGVLP